MAKTHFFFTEDIKTSLNAQRTFQHEYGRLTLSQGEYKISFFWWRIWKNPSILLLYSFDFLFVFSFPIGPSSISLVLSANTTLS